MTAVSRAVVALALVAAPVAAQAPGLPVHGGGVRSGVEVAATVGWAGTSSFTGETTTWAGTVAWGSGRLGIAGTVGTLNHDPEGSVITLGALGTVHLLGNGVDTPFEVSLFGGYGWFDRQEYVVYLPAAAVLDDDLQNGVPGNWRVLLGGSIVAAITTPIGSIRPWLAPRVDLFQLTISDATSDRTRLAGSAGVDVRFPVGLSVRLLWDQVDGYDATLGVGLAYRF